MHLTRQEENDSWRWFFAAGLFAVLLSIVLYKLDVSMSTSTREADLGKTLKELRGAQASLADQNLDLRLKQSLPR